MKVKVLNFIVVGLFTLLVISPGILVFNIVWEKHLEFINMQNLLCDIENNYTGNSQITLPEASRNLSQHQRNNQMSDNKALLQADRNLVNRLLVITQQYRLASILQWFVLITPVFVGLGIIIYDRYLAYRAAILKEQVEILEKLWQESIE
jgi:hypothetical protein